MRRGRPTAMDRIVRAKTPCLIQRQNKKKFFETNTTRSSPQADQSGKKTIHAENYQQTNRGVVSLKKKTSQSTLQNGIELQRRNRDSTRRESGKINWNGYCEARGQIRAEKSPSTLRDYNARKHPRKNQIAKTQPTAANPRPKTEHR